MKVSHLALAVRVRDLSGWTVRLCIYQKCLTPEGIYDNCFGSPASLSTHPSYNPAVTGTAHSTLSYFTPRFYLNLFINLTLGLHSSTTKIRYESDKRN